mmetsp:Transcript_13893/g.39527  ORF Transcript_13893/g.39527 Transcript_13893/m.39527 type:complete len:433 (+) Transcript_13893:376-1674(+)
MDSLIDRIDENRLDALYLFINETLRDPATYNRFLDSLLAVLPHNWSIQRVEVGHEFLSMSTRADNNNGTAPVTATEHSQQQQQLFDMICNLEALKTLIFSDGYVPRKDAGSIQTSCLLQALPKATNLCNLDVQRLQLSSQEEVDHLAQVLSGANMADSLEEVRMTGLYLKPPHANNLNSFIEACTEMTNLRSLAISMMAAPPEGAEETTAPPSAPAAQAVVGPIISHDSLRDLCQISTTLQDLSLRAMDLDDAQCQTIANALTTNSFLTSLDIRQNPRIGQVGYKAILEALERNYDLWCTVNVDNENFQGKFAALIELNQANRGDLVRSPTRNKLVEFLITLKDDPTAIWYFLTIHDTILFPLISFLKWKLHQTNRNAAVSLLQNDTNAVIELLSSSSSPPPQPTTTTINAANVAVAACEQQQRPSKRTKVV